MRRWLALVLLLGSGFPVGAQTIAVLGGEHGDFTRLTFPVDVREQWTLVPTGTGYDLTFEATGRRFDLARAYDRIQTDRVASLRPEGPTLHIDLGCECMAESFVWNDSHLIVDIKPGSDPSLQAEAGAEPAAVLPSITEGRDQTGPRPSPASSRMDLALNQAAQSQTATAGLQLDIARSIARAATQGLLEPKGGGLGEIPEPPAPHPEVTQTETMSPTGADPVTQPTAESATPMDIDLGAEQVNGAANFGITFETSIDRDSPGLGSAELRTQTEPGCLPEPLFDMETWVDDRPFSAQIGEKRVTLTSELDRVPAGAAVALAKTYIAFGFGREAIRALAIDGTSSQERRVLASMAAALDEMPMPYPELGTQARCATAAALWAMLAHPPEERVRPADKGAVLRSYQQLTPPLQALLGPRLAERFVALDDPESADAVLNRLAPVSADVSSTEGKQAEAAIAGHRAGPAAEIEALTEIARDDIRMTPEALVSLLTLARVEGRPVDEDMIDLSAAFRFEYRTAPILADLIRAEAQLLTDLGRFDDALALLAEESAHLDPSLLVRLTSETIESLTAKGDDFAFLGRVMTDLPKTITPDAQNAVAARLLKMRFPDRAMSLLLGPSNGAAAAERRYLNAEASIQMGNTADALRYISGFSDSRAARIRAAALQASEDFGAAYSATTVGAGATPEPDAAWRAGVWADLARSDDPLLQSAGAAMLNVAGPNPGDTTTGPSIANGQSVLDSTRQSRDMIDALLARYQAPEG